jgi:hypothetical protein
VQTGVQEVADMTAMPSGLQMIGSFSIASMGGLLIYVLRRQQKQIDAKADKDGCRERHKRIEKDLTRGEEKFDAFGEKLNTLAVAQGDSRRR